MAIFSHQTINNTQWRTSTQPLRPPDIVLDLFKKIKKSNLGKLYSHDRIRVNHNDSLTILSKYKCYYPNMDNNQNQLIIKILIFN